MRIQPNLIALYGRLAPYSLHDRHEYRTLAGGIGCWIASKHERLFSGEFTRFKQREGKPERSPILSGFVAHCDPSLYRDLAFYDVLRSVAGDAYVKSSRRIRLSHSDWRSGRCFRWRVSHRYAV